MSELEQRLHALGGEIDYPPAPALTLPTSPAPEPRRRRRLVTAAFAFVLLLACLGAVLAVSPSARSGLRDVFGIGSVRVIRLPEAPPAAARLVPFGRPVSLAAAERAVAFDIRLPESVDGRPPDQVFLDDSVGGGLVSIVWCCSPRIVLSQLLGSDLRLLQKSVGPATRIEEVSVDGRPGLWVEGADHELRVFDSHTVPRQRPVRVRGAVLLWVDGTVTMRLEGELSQAEALAIARRVR